MVLALLLLGIVLEPTRYAAMAALVTVRPATGRARAIRRPVWAIAASGDSGEDDATIRGTQKPVEACPDLQMYPKARKRQSDAVNHRYRAQPAPSRVPAGCACATWGPARRDGGMMRMTDLSGQAAIVTGASRGIGAAAARELAAAGAAVLLAARTAGAIEEVAAEIRASGGRAETVTADVSRYADVEAMAGRCRETFGRLDILVNNAGVIEPIARLAERTRTPGRTPPTSTTRASISACARCCR
jgi:hypothetical protein